MRLTIGVLSLIPFLAASACAQAPTGKAGGGAPFPDPTARKGERHGQNHSTPVGEATIRIASGGAFGLFSELLLTPDDRLTEIRRNRQGPATRKESRLRQGAYQAALRQIERNPLPESALRTAEPCIDYGTDSVSVAGIRYMASCPMRELRDLQAALKRAIDSYR